MDYQVLKAQQWVNATYQNVSGYVACAETGKTGWSTMYSLTRGLQHELGITALSDNFGDGTLSAMNAQGPVSAGTANTHIKTIVEAALYCKGYPGGDIDGTFGSSTQAGVLSAQADMGFPDNGGTVAVTPKQMKTLLTMDAYVLLPGGDSRVRDVQRWLNSFYVSRRDFQIVPADGFFSRNVQKGLMLAIQYSLGMADGVANGTFGPGTKSGLQSHGSFGVGAQDGMTERLVSLFKAALIFNNQPGVDWGSGTFTSTTASVTRAFQDFCLLTASGSADFETWCSLLVSTGDPDRPGHACDCMTPLNDARAKAIKAAGYETVGRYIVGGTTKLLTTSEIQVLFDNDLTFFPIYQVYNNALSYFDDAQGRTQAQGAHDSATSLGLPRGSIIYFAVDFDATADEVRSNVVPFFQGVAAVFEGLGNRYSVGVYGSRNICTMVCEAGYAISSFIGGLSTGFSGNLGFPLPSNWAFDQIQTLTLASGQAGQIEIDKDVKSGRDQGISDLTKPIDQNAAFLTWVRWIEARAGEWRQSHTDHTTQELTAFYLRTYIDDRYVSGTGYGGITEWGTVAGDVDQDFLDYCRSAKGRPDPGILRDPGSGLLCDIQHFGASVGAVYAHTLDSSASGISMVDFGGWVGDLITMAADAYNDGIADDAAYSYAYNLIGNNAGQKSFSSGDMLADVDAMVIGLATQADGSLSLSDAFAARYATASSAQARFGEFIARRFGSRATMTAAAENVFGQNSDAELDTFRGALWLDKTHVPIGISTAKHPTLFQGVCDAFADVVADRFA